MSHDIVPIAFFAMITILGVSRPLARALAARSTPRPELDGETQRRLERMEQAIESIAIEVERISEGQRFTTKLLAERNAAAGAPLAAGSQPVPDERRRASNG